MSAPASSTRFGRGRCLGSPASKCELAEDPISGEVGDRCAIAGTAIPRYDPNSEARRFTSRLTFKPVSASSAPPTRLSVGSTAARRRQQLPG